jgi:hypothetical protein
MTPDELAAMRERDARRGVVAELLRAAPPAYLARTLLDIREGAVVGVGLVDENGTMDPVDAAFFAVLVREEMDRRLRRSRERKGRGT